MAFPSTLALSPRSTVSPPRPRRASASRTAPSSPAMASKTDASSLSSSPRHAARPASPGTRIPRPVSCASGDGKGSTPALITPVDSRPSQLTSLSLAQQLALEDLCATAAGLYSQLEQLEAEGDDAAFDELDELVALTADLDSLIARISAGDSTVDTEVETVQHDSLCWTSGVAVLPPSPDFATPPSSPRRIRTPCASPSSSLDTIGESDESDFEDDSLFDSFSSAASSCGEDEEDSLFSPLSTPPSSPEPVVIFKSGSLPACLPSLAIELTKLPSCTPSEADDLAPASSKLDLPLTSPVELATPTAPRSSPRLPPPSPTRSPPLTQTIASTSSARSSASLRAPTALRRPRACLRRSRSLCGS
ncbi:hypothetical protein JCM10207_004224 [Rhodosporidiobolus poonsookiae]